MHRRIAQNGSFAVRHSTSATAQSLPVAKLDTIETPSRLQRSVFDVMQRYEDFIGLTAVKDAQTKVVIAERQFTERQEDRRAKQSELQLIQERLKEIHAELDRTSRGEDRYLHLLTKEHEYVKREKLIHDQFQMLEKSERTAFHRLSMYLRESHEKERERGERTKYWAIIGSIIGATIGVLGTTINNRMRMRELRDLVHESSDPVRVNGVIQQLTDMVTQQQTQVQLFISDVKAMMHGAMTGVVIEAERAEGTHIDDILQAIRKQEKQMDSEMELLKRMIATEKGYDSHAADSTAGVVYVGPEMSTLLEQSIADLEWRMKLQTLLHVVAVYGGLVILLPVMYAIFKGQ